MATRNPPRPPTPARDDPPRGLVPTFAAPPPENPANLTQEPETGTTPHPPTMTAGRVRVTGPARFALGGDDDAPPREASPAPLEEQVPRIPRTGTSTGGDSPKALTTAEVTGLVVGVLAVVVSVAGAVVRWQTRRQLRKPTDTEAKNVAAPLGRILARRAGDVLALLGPDIGDGLQAAAAAGAYVGNGPLLQHLDPGDPNLPANLQEETPSNE